MADQDKTQAKQEGPVFTIQRIYVKDVSFETPHAPEIFREEWKPEVNVDLQTKTNRLEEGIYDVVLHLTVTVKMGEKTAFLVEVHQAGIFTLRGFPQEQLAHALGSMCPNILYPYARETISDIVIRGGFPQLLLAPVNFDALYLQHLEQQKKGEAGGTTRQ
jgi:preprotein translocase subunit SecB